MTADRFRALLAALHWSNRTVASILGYDEATVRRWARLDGLVPHPVAQWLERVAKPLLAHPRPAGWAMEKRERGRPARN